MIGVIAIIMQLVICCPNHPLNKSEDLRVEVAGHFEAAGDKFGILPALLVRWAYEESSLRLDAVGTRGEIGVCQAHGKALKTCRVAGYDVLTYRGGIYCMAMLMDMGQRRCGSLERGLYWYASGVCEGTPRARRITKRRLKAVRKGI